MESAPPYISVVATARNDDHGGNLLGRMQAFVSGWIAQSKRHGLSSELIIVEWNPPAGRCSLREALQWPADLGCCDVRFIEVPPEVHRRYTHAEALPLYQMIAKNVGVRRARGQFILATNIDILFSDELVAFLADRRLEQGRMYRIDRHDVMSDVPMEADIGAQLEYCRTHLIRINAREGTFPLDADGCRALAAQDIADRESGLRFGTGWFSAEHWSEDEVFRWVDNDAELLFSPPPGVPPVLVFDVEPGPGAGNGPLALQVLDTAGQVLARAVFHARGKIRLPLSAAAAAAGRLILHVSGGGRHIDLDPRLLNFRVFHCGWATESPAGSARRLPARELRPAAISPWKRAALLWRRLQTLIRHIASSDAILTVPVLVTPRLRRAAALYVEWGGLTGSLWNGPNYVLRKRHFKASAAPGCDVFDPKPGIRPGSGWGPLERYRAESFRWIENDAELILPPAAGESTTLSLQIEPGPGTGHRRFDLLVCDDNENIVAHRVVRRLEFVQLLLPRRPARTEVFTLKLESPNLPDPIDGRIRNFRVFWCGTGEEPAGPAAFSELAPLIRLGAGWTICSGFGAEAHGDAAELVVTAPETVAAPLFVDCGSSLEHDPVEFSILDAHDKTVGNMRVDVRQILRLDLSLRPGRTAVFRFVFPPRSAPAPRFNVFALSWKEQQLSPDAAHALPGQGQSSTASFLHTNGCGDFTLLSREHWFDLRGYPEFDLFSMNIDSVLCYAAHYGGAREEMLCEPMRIYHIEHGTGSGWTPEGQARLFARIAAKGLSFVSFADVVNWAAFMRRLACPMIFNHQDWGLADLNLKETCPPASGSSAERNHRGITAQPL